MTPDVVTLTSGDNYLYCCISGNEVAVIDADAADEMVFGELRRRKDLF